MLRTLAVGLPQPSVSPFPLDPEVTSEAVWSGEILRPSTIAADRRALHVRVLTEAGDLQVAPWSVTAIESMLATLADPDTAPELYALRERARGWRFTMLCAPTPMRLLDDLDQRPSRPCFRETAAPCPVRSRRCYAWATPRPCRAPSARLSTAPRSIRPEFAV